MPKQFIQDIEFPCRHGDLIVMDSSGQRIRMSSSLKSIGFTM